MRQLSVLIKPVSGACNMRCAYCFYADEMTHWKTPKPAVMEDATLETVIRKTLDAADGPCTFGFQGGEPTLAGLPFFRRVVALQRRHNRRGVPVRNLLQTNGLLIDGRWAAFLAENRFLVGVSLDGPPELHDRCRRDGAGRGTAARAERAVRLLQANGAAVNVLAVVTAESAGRAGALYSYFKRLGLRHQQYLPCLPPLFCADGEDTPTAEQYGTFLVELFELWEADRRNGTSVRIRYFENLMALLAGGAPERCGMCGRCANQHVVEADGSVYPCDFYVLDGYRLGSLRTDGFRQLSARLSETDFLAASMRVEPQCAVCPWRRLCGGGCRRDRQGGRPEELGVNRFCDAYRRLFAHAVPRMLALLHDGEA